MKELEVYRSIFCEVFAVDEEELGENFHSENVETWDSIGHMNLISTIEEEFDVVFEGDDIMAFRSYCDGIRILRKYGVAIEERMENE